MTEAAKKRRKRKGKGWRARKGKEDRTEGLDMMPRRTDRDKQSRTGRNGTEKSLRTRER